MNHLQYLGGFRRHYVVLPQLGVGYGRVPKAANSIIKRLLARAAGLEYMFGDEAFSQDRNWRTKQPNAYFLTGAQARRRFPDLVLFSFVREPLSRLASCYRSKITRPEALHDSLQREGLKKDVSFPKFVKHVCGRSDWRSNIHYRSQAQILNMRGGTPPDFIGQVEQLELHWRMLSEMLADRGHAQLPSLPRRKRTATDSQMKTGDLFDGDQGLIEMAQRRYADDLALFYGEAPLPGHQNGAIFYARDKRTDYA